MITFHSLSNQEEIIEETERENEMDAMLRGRA